MTRRTTDGYRIASKWSGEGILKGWYVDAASKEIDRLIRKRMAEAWEEGWLRSWEANHVGRIATNPYRGRSRKK